PHSGLQPRHGRTRTARREYGSSAFCRVACKNNAFSRAKLARHVRCAVLVVVLGTSSPLVSPRIIEYAIVNVAATGMFTWYHGVPRCTTPVAVAVAVKMQYNQEPAQPIMKPCKPGSWCSRQLLTRESELPEIPVLANGLPLSHNIAH